MDKRHPISTFLGIAAGLVLATNSHAADIFVNGFCGNDAWSGLSDVCLVPDGPKATIQAGIDAANPGDVVIVAEGEYFENINFNGKAITVRSTDPNDAGVVINTIINGGGSGSVVRCTSVEGSDTVLSGFVITGGNATFGGGMRIGISSPTVTNCTFSGNSATSEGGGMFNGFTSSPTVSNCTFSGNSAGSGGGGGMVNFSNSSPAVTNCTFSGNAAANGGGMYNLLSGDSSPTVSNCSFSGNTATNSGGGMFNGASSPTVTNSVLCENIPENIFGSYDDGGDTATTWLLEAGVGEQATMAITGHRTRSMLDRYGHRRRAAAKAAQAKLPEFRMTGTDPSACRMLAVPLSSGGVDCRPVAIDGDADDSENAFLARSGGSAAAPIGTAVRRVTVQDQPQRSIRAAFAFAVAWSRRRTRRRPLRTRGRPRAR